MVKKVLFSLFVALIPVLTLSAQSQRFPHTESHDHSHDGRVFVGGSLNYWYNTDNQKSTFSFRPEAGYLFNDTWGAGAFLAYEFEDGQHGVGVTPFVRYYLLFAPSTLQSLPRWLCWMEYDAHQGCSQQNNYNARLGGRSAPRGLY